MKKWKLGLCVIAMSVVGLTSWQIYMSQQVTAKPVPVVTKPEDGIHYVFITGAVRHPGLYSFDEDVRIGEVVHAAGDVVAYADVSKVNMAATATDGSHIHIPYTRQGVPKDTQEDDGLVNINQADERELSTLSGIGPTTAKRIVMYRNKNGPFTTCQDICKVKGIGPSKYDEFKYSIKV